MVIWLDLWSQIPLWDFWWASNLVPILELASWGGKIRSVCSAGKILQLFLVAEEKSTGRWDKCHLLFRCTLYLTWRRRFLQLKFKCLCRRFEGLSSLRLLPENQNLVRIILGTDSKCERLKYCQHGNLHNIIAGENKLSTTYSNALWAVSLLEHTKIISTIYQRHKAQDFKNQIQVLEKLVEIQFCHQFRNWKVVINGHSQYWGMIDWITYSVLLLNTLHPQKALPSCFKSSMKTR